MYKNFFQEAKPVTFSHLNRKGYAIFNTLSREVRIGVLSVATLSCACIQKVEARVHATISQEQSEEQDEQRLDEVTVSGTLAPLTQLQSARIVTVLSRQDIEQAGVQSVNDLMKLATGVDVRQRGGFGIQTDISLDGGSFEQITLLLNGVNINNPQIGHYSADFPFSISDIERIEVLEGAASRVYGGQSFGGAVNIVTRRDRANALSVNLEGGMNGTVLGEGRLVWAQQLAPGRPAPLSGLRQGGSPDGQTVSARPAVVHRLSGGGGRSDGGTENSAWKKGQAYYQGDWANSHLRLDWQFGFSKKSFGANTFYSAAYPDQYDRNERYILSVGGETQGKVRISPTFYWQRAYDNFELIHNTTTGENFHYAEVYGTKVSGYTSWRAGRTAFGADFRQEGILSTNLGTDLGAEQYVSVRGEKETFYTRHDNRTTISYNLEHNVLLRQWTLSLGLMASTTPSIDHRHRFYPGMDVAYRPATDWKLYLSYNKGFRLPSFTELYYKSPTHEGNKGLRPEENHSFQLGAQYHRRGVLATARAFYHRGRGIIDWVMYTPDDSYHSAAFQLDNLSAQARLRLDFPQLVGRQTWLRQLDLGYTYIHQTRHDAVEVFKSNCALEYLRHKLVANLHHKIWRNLSATWSLRWQDRMGGYVSHGQTIPYAAYATLDAKVQWTDPRFDVYLQGTNLTDCRYQDLGNIPQPGIWVMAGARWRLTF